jgi:hypothetical protein
MANRPKVFLSHSSIDKPFINQLNDDLRKCKIDTWLDTEEIRDGRSWMKVIFEDGIPACDAVLVYLTENSIGSKMVKKELDVALLHQLENGGVAVLPYVSNVGVRSHLRPDLQTLHCRVWNEQNYQETLPSVVAEIWHSYLERVVETATSKEKVRRLELELENQQLKQAKEQDIFTQQEERDFQYLYQALGKGVELHLEFLTGVTDSTGEPAPRQLMLDAYEILPLELLLYHIDSGERTVSPYTLLYSLRGLVKMAGHVLDWPRDSEDGYTEVGRGKSLIVYLQMFGLLTTEPIGRTEAAYNRDRYGYTEKLFRFKYWLTYNNLYPTTAHAKYIGRITSDKAEQDGSST